MFSQHRLVLDFWWLSAPKTVVTEYLEFLECSFTCQGHQQTHPVIFNTIFWAPVRPVRKGSSDVAGRGS